VSARAAGAAAAAHVRRPRARRGEGAHLRTEILDAAERILIETGDQDAVSIRAVADAVGVTPPSIYLHFADKNDLLFAVCERHFVELDEVIERASAGIADPVDALYARGRAYIRFGVDHPEAYRILFMTRPTAMPVEALQERVLQSASFAHLVSSVRRCIDARAFAGEATPVAVGLWTVVHGITSLLVAKPDFPWPDVDALVDHVLRAQIAGLRALSGV
jgi:AcrR family transcriptional regulator